MRKKTLGLLLSNLSSNQSTTKEVYITTVSSGCVGTRLSAKPEGDSEYAIFLLDTDTLLQTENRKFVPLELLKKPEL